MNKQIITLSENAANRIKEIMSKAEKILLALEWVLNLAGAQACLMLWNMQKKLTQAMKL